MKPLAYATVVVLALAVISLVAVRAFCPDFGNLIGSRHSQPIPTDHAARTEKDFYREMYLWMHRHTLEAFQNYAVPSGRHTAALDFLEGVCHSVAYPTELEAYRQLAAKGAELVAGGCDDALVKLWYGEVLFHAKQPEKAEPFLMTAYSWEDTPYPMIHTFFALKALATIANGNRSHRPDEAKGHLLGALDRFCYSLLNRAFTDSEAPIAFRLLNDLDGSSDTISKFGFVLDVLENNGGGDPWLMNMIRGYHEIDLAWELRGTGWAPEVTEEGWRGFKAHLSKAREIFIDTWRAYPNRPESALGMMVVTRGGCGVPGELVRMWFDRAVRIQMDYPDVYYEMLHALQPRWGGSHAEMLAFGRECLGTDRYDTDVPLFYLYALRRIGVELEHNRWRLPFRYESEQETIDSFFDKLLAEPGRTDARHRILTQQALVSAWRGEYADARRMLEDIDADVDLREGFLGKALSWSNRSRSTIDSDVKTRDSGLRCTMLRKTGIYKWQLCLSKRALT